MSEDKNAVKEAVLARIRQGNDFPAMSSTISNLNRFNPKDDISITEFANVILKDIALTSKILKLVNSVHYMQYGEVTTISRAIILLGFENVKNIALTLILFDHLQKHKSNEYLMDSIMKSFYSAILSQKISEEIGFVDREEAFLCSLFHIFGKMLLAFSIPDKIKDIDIFMANHHVSEAVASLSVLGISYEEIGSTIAREWNFPKKIIHSMKRIMPSELSDNQTEIDKLRSLSTFTHNVSNIISSEDSPRERDASMDKLLKSFAVHFRSIEGRMEDLLKSTSQDFVDFSNVFHIDLRASQFSKKLLGLEDKTPTVHKRTKETVNEMPESIESFDDIIEMESYDSPESIFRKGIQDINKSLLSGFSLNDVVRIVLETMFRGLQLSGHSRVLFTVRDTKKPIMNVRYGFGNAIAESKEWFEITLNDNKDIFNISINNKKDFVIKNISSPDIFTMLPTWYQKRVSGEIFIILLPIVVNNLSIGIYYIEGQKEELAKISSMHLNNLKILRDQTVMAIKQKRGF